MNNANKFIVTILLICPICFSSPYHLSKLDIAYIALSGAAMGSSIWYKEKNQIVTSEILNLDKSDLNSMDRLLLHSEKPNIRLLSDLVYWGSYVSAPLSIGFLNKDKSQRKFNLFKNKSEEWLIIPVMYLEAVLTTTASFNLAKGSVRRYRPAAYIDKKNQLLNPQTGISRSFFSGHAGIISATSIFMVKIIDDYNRDNINRPLLWSSGIAIALAGSELRNLCGRHHFTDVITGVLIGGGIGFIVPHLHKKENGKTSIAPYSNGRAHGIFINYKL